VSLTAIGFVVIFLLCLGLAFARHPAFGLYAYLWVFYNHPPHRWWGVDLPDLRWSLIAALVTLIAVALKPKMVSRPHWANNWGARFLGIFVAWLWIQSMWALDFNLHLVTVILFTKFILLFYLMYQCLSDREQFENFCFLHVLGCFIFGWVAYMTPYGSFEQGRLEGVGGPGLDAANTFAMHMATGLPFAGFLLFTCSGIKRWIIFLSIPFILNGVFLAGSRGAIVGLMGAGLVSLYLCPKIHRKYLYLIGVLGAILLMMLVNVNFLERMEMITGKASQEMTRRTGATEDGSAMSRIIILKGGWNMFLDYPSGVGSDGHEILSFDERYLPPSALSGRHGRAAHNTFMKLLVEHGVLGGLLFIAMGIWITLTLWRLKRLDRIGLPMSLGFYRAAIGGSLAVHFVSGQFASYLRPEVGVWLIGLLVLLSQYSYQSLREKGEHSSMENERGSVRPRVKNGNGKAPVLVGRRVRGGPNKMIERT
jgi:hypothetical protein